MRIAFYIFLNAVLLGFSYKAVGSDSDLLSSISADRQDLAIVEYLEPGEPSAEAAATYSRPMKPVNAFGTVFSGDVGFKEGFRDRIAIWTHDPLMRPHDAVQIFRKLTGALEGEFGEGEVIDNIPNYGDGSEVKSSASLWFLRDEIVVLRLDQYSSRGGISLVRENSESWRNSMGADESVFWSKALDEKSEPQRQPESSKEHSPKWVTNEPLPTVSEPDTADNRGATQAESDAQNEERETPTWPLLLGAIAVLSVAVILVRAFMRGRAP
jgi:hypothetical protein